MRRAFCLITLVLATGACSTGRLAGTPATPLPEDPAVLASDLAKTRPVGPGSAYRPLAVSNPKVQSGEPVGSLRCRSAASIAYGAHIELFARNRGVQVPAGIGISQPRVRGPFVEGGRCRYELSTTSPTGVVQVQAGRSSGAPTLRALFALWGQPLSRVRLASFRGTVIAFLDGQRWPRDPQSIPLRRHAQIVLEMGPLVQPHSSYLFPPGL